jgi:hypothetical protein
VLEETKIDRDLNFVQLNVYGCQGNTLKTKAESQKIDDEACLLQHFLVFTNIQFSFAEHFLFVLLFSLNIAGYPHLDLPVHLKKKNQWVQVQATPQIVLVMREM